MSIDDRTNDPRSEWQKQPTEDFRMTPALLERYVSTSRRRLRLLSVAQYAGVTWGIMASIWAAAIAGGRMLRIGAVLMALLFAFVLVLGCAPSACAWAPSQNDGVHHAASMRSPMLLRRPIFERRVEVTTSRAAASTSRIATRSLIEPPGLNDSSLATIWGVRPAPIRERRTSGVSPTVSRIESLMSAWTFV